MSLGQILFFHHMKLHKSNNWHCAPKTCSQSLVFILPNFEKRLGEKWLSFDFFVIRKEWIRVELDFRSHRSWMVKVFLSFFFFFVVFFPLPWLAFGRLPFPKSFQACNQCCSFGCSFLSFLFSRSLVA